MIAAAIAFGIAAAPTHFDVPLGTVTVPAKSMEDPQGNVRCTFFPDLVVRESNVDMLPPGAVSLLPAMPAPTAAACRGAPAAGTRKLNADGLLLLGRLRHFLVFENPASAAGAMTFRLLDLRSGAVVWQDDWTGESFDTRVTPPGGSLEFQYRHAVIADCSLRRDAAGCWMHLARRGLLPPIIAGQPPPSCDAAYRRDMAPPDNPSIVAWAMFVRIDPAGHASGRGVGDPGCLPMP